MTYDDSTVRSLDTRLLSLLASTNSATLSAPEIAHAIAEDEDWHALISPIRRAAIALASEGRVVIYRKGKPVDPQNFSGVYRIGLPRSD